MLRSHLSKKMAVAILAMVLFCSPAVAIDLTRPLTECLPPGIGVDPGDAPPVDWAPDAADPTYEDTLIELVNQERWDNGQLAPYKRVDLLDTSSETHSINMAARNFVMHCDPDTLTQPWDRMVAAGYIWSSAAENIAWGQQSPAEVMTSWMGSPFHRANILSTTYREMGNGFYNQNGDQGNVRRVTTTSCTPNVFNEGPFYRYWTQNFGRRSSVYPVVIDREAYLTDTRNVSLYLYPGGAEMRIRNETGTWSAWQPHSANVAWQLSYGNGTKTVNVEMRTGGTVRSSSDTIILEDTSDIVFIDGFNLGNTSSWSSVSP